MSKIINLEVKLSRNKHFVVSKIFENSPPRRALKFISPWASNRINTVCRYLALKKFGQSIIFKISLVPYFSYLKPMDINFRDPLGWATNRKWASNRKDMVCHYKDFAL
jgi:hypothetical protein